MDEPDSQSGDRQTFRKANSGQILLFIKYLDIIVDTQQSEILMQQVGEAVVATTETVEQLAEHLDILAKQVQQQGYQILAIGETVQTLAENQDLAMERLTQQMAELIEKLQQIASVLEQQNHGGDRRA